MKRFKKEIVIVIENGPSMLSTNSRQAVCIHTNTLEKSKNQSFVYSALSKLHGKLVYLTFTGQLI